MKFEVGKTYYCRSACNYDSIFRITVASRTEKTLTTSEGKRLGIRIRDGVESVSPEGRYSMSPTIYANREDKGDLE